MLQEFLWIAFGIFLGCFQIPNGKLPESFWDAFRIACRFFCDTFRFWDASRVLLGCTRTFPGILLDSFWDASKIRQGCFKNPLKCLLQISFSMLQKSFRYSSRNLLGCFQVASRMPTNSLWDVSRNGLGCFQNPSSMLPKSIWNSRNILEISLEPSQKNSGSILKGIWKGHFKVSRILEAFI